MQIKFGTDGWRGRIARDFTFENVARVIQAFCDIFTESSVPQFVYLGYDRRFLSREFAEQAAMVLTANGIEVRMASQFCPTPCISWMTKEFGAGAGIAVTASHNPFEWNGIKFKEPGGRAASPDYTMPIEERVEANQAAGRKPMQISLEAARQNNLLSDFDPLGPYVEQLRAMVDIELIRRAGWNIVTDPMYGAGTGFFAAVLGETLKEIHADGNPCFGMVQPEPIEKNLSELLEVVHHEGIDVGLATDGDADRIGAVDEEGRFVDSHHIFALLLRHLVEHRGWKGELVKTISTTHMIDKLANKYGLKLHLTPIGFKHVSAKFDQIDALIGGEESGGIAIARHVHERDGVLSGLMLLELMTVEKKKLGEIICEMEEEIGPHRFQRDDITVSDEQAASIRDRLQDFSVNDLAGTKVREVNRMDGLHLTLEDGSWILVRPSGTEPLLRVYVESSSEERVQDFLTAIRKELQL